VRFALIARGAVREAHCSQSAISHTVPTIASRPGTPGPLRAEVLITGVPDHELSAPGHVRCNSVAGAYKLWPLEGTGRPFRPFTHPPGGMTAYKAAPSDGRPHDRNMMPWGSHPLMGSLVRATGSREGAGPAHFSAPCRLQIRPQGSPACCLKERAVEAPKRGVLGRFSRHRPLPYAPLLGSLCRGRFGPL